MEYYCEIYHKNSNFSVFTAKQCTNNSGENNDRHCACFLILFMYYVLAFFFNFFKVLIDLFLNIVDPIHQLTGLC